MPDIFKWGLRRSEIRAADHYKQLKNSTPKTTSNSVFKAAAGAKLTLIIEFEVSVTSRVGSLDFFSEEFRI